LTAGSVMLALAFVLVVTLIVPRRSPPDARGRATFVGHRTLRLTGPGRTRARHVPPYRPPLTKEFNMSDTTEHTPTQKRIGDFALKLVQLTDEVLFGDVWARPELSPPPPATEAS
jgi:hypothetical protein